MNCPVAVICMRIMEVLFISIVSLIVTWLLLVSAPGKKDRHTVEVVNMMDLREIQIRNMSEEQKQLRMKALLRVVNRPYRTPEEKLKMRTEIQQLQTDLTQTMCVEPDLTRKLLQARILPTDHDDEGEDNGNC